jgi:hypothetical protein
MEMIISTKHKESEEQNTLKYAAYLECDSSIT